MATCSCCSTAISSETVLCQNCATYRQSEATLLGARYSSAWQEVSARIQSRDNVFMTFVQVATILLGFSSQSGWSRAALGIGFAALASAWMNRHHDMIILALGEYQKDLGKAMGIEWVESSSWKKAVRGRFWRDLAQFGFTIVAGSAAALISMPPDWGSMRISVLWIMSTCSSAAALLVLAITHTERKAQIPN